MGYLCRASFTFSFTYSPRIEGNNSRPEKQEMSEKTSKLDV